VRSLAEQTVDELGGSGSLLVRQRRDHARLDALLDEVEAGAAQDDALNRLWRLVFPHAYAEETVVWPVIRRTLADGDALTVRVEQEHQEINALVSRIDRTPAGVERDALVAEVVALLRRDARDEEDLLLPRLQEQLTHVQLRRLGRTWELVRRTAPTRPHAVVSRRPPGNVLAAMPLMVLDRTRDALDATARRSSTAAAVLRPSSRALARAAGAVERLAPVRRGERGSTSATTPDG
jgi:hypothetical protein